MIPFLHLQRHTAGAGWRPFWVLWLMLAAAGMQVLAAWLEWGGIASRPPHGRWCTARTAGAGGRCSGVAGMGGGWCKASRTSWWPCCTLDFCGWASPSCWVASRSGWRRAGRWQPGHGRTHALSMGCPASLMLAMVGCRVATAGGLVADHRGSRCSACLRLATLLRIAATFACVASGRVALVCCWPAPACGSSPWGCGGGGALVWPPDGRPG